MEGIVLILIVAFPILMGLAMLFVPGRYVAIWRYAALVVAFIEIFLCSWTYYNVTTGEGYPEVRCPWLLLSFSSFGVLKVDFHLKVDGLSLSLILLSSLVIFVSTLSSFDIKKYSKGYYLLSFLLTSSVLGCFLANDFLLFFLFFEFMLLPMYFLVGIWGGDRREYAAIKFFLYTLLGSVFILLVLIATYSSVFHPLETLKNIPSTGLEVKRLLQMGMIEDAKIIHSLDFDYIFNADNYLPGSVLDREAYFDILGWDVRAVLFFFFLLGFAIKLPVVPVHTWLPDAHVEAPTAVSVILAGILLKIGGYGIIKLVMPLFPDLAESNAFWVAILGVISMLYGGMNALAQTDLKKLIAYSSVAHMGFVMLGIGSVTSEGVKGAMFQMVSHGVISSLLFLLAGVIYERTHDRTIANYRGLASIMPYYTVISVVAYFAALGLPVFSGFIAELSIYMGAFSAATAGILPMGLVLISLLALLIGAAYCLWTLQRIFFGEYWIKPSLANSPMVDLTAREWCMLMPLVFFAILLGVYPALLFDLF